MPSKLMRYATILLLWLTAVLLPLSVRAAGDEALKAGIFDPPREAPDFSVEGSDGSPLILSRYRGKVVVMAFGYTHCPNVCPVTLAVLAQAHRSLGALGSQVQVIYLTVDPERDSAGRLKSYLAGFDPSFIGGTGSASQMEAVGKSYGVTATRLGSGDDYAVAHSSFIYLITRDGKLRGLMPFGHQAGDFVHDISLLLK